MSEAIARGHDAARPSGIPRAGWRDIALRAKRRMDEGHLMIIAAGVAFYALFALSPALIATVSIYGMFADPQQVQQLLSAAAAVLPPEAQSLLEQQIEEIAGAPGTALGVGALFTLAIALWSATAGMRALLEALNIAYSEEERRGFVWRSLLAVLLTVGAVAFALLALAVIVALPPLLAVLELPAVGGWLVAVIRWPLLGLAAMVALGVLYRVGPSRRAPQWRWVSWGAFIAVLIWILASIGFSWYVSNFADYNATYGALGAIVILMMWLFISSMCILLGALINGEMEHQTRHDTTRDGERPMGERGAYVADHLGRQP